ncbi:MAG: hypothetical protein GWO24_07665, partial [Akkermansiaceae bacterium]|nr:hypothetical protein [Akkermansiaceae bacterium]
MAGNLFKDSERLNSPLLAGVPYRQETAYLRTILLSFLPILILIILLFLLFRHQMKQA